MCLVEYHILVALACVCSLSEVIEKIQQQGNHIWMFFLTLFALLFTLNHPSLSSMQTLPHLLSFVLLLSFHHPAPVFLCQSLCQLKQPQTQAELTRIRSEKISTTPRTWPAPAPRLGVILSRDLPPTRSCWIPAICFTALAFKCLIEPLISWTVAVCVCVCVNETEG